MKKVKTKSLSQNIRQLEEITREFESGEIDLEESVGKFKKGLDLAKEIQKRLKEIENEIIKIQSEHKEK